MRPEAASEAIFIVVCCRRCSESLPEPILGGSDPSKLCSHHNGSTILTKSPFSKKHRKSTLRGPVLGPKIAEIDVGGSKIANIGGKNRFFDRPFFHRFFEHRKNRKNPKKDASIRSAGSGRRSTRTRRRGKERQALRETGMESELGLTRQHPGGVRRILSASRIPPSQIVWLL